MDMTLAQRAVAFAAIVFLFLLLGFTILTADPLRLTTLSPNPVASIGGSHPIAIALRRHDGVSIASGATRSGFATTPQTNRKR